jgi:hypothetical protein
VLLVITELLGEQREHLTHGAPPRPGTGALVGDGMTRLELHARRSLFVKVSGDI